VDTIVQVVLMVASAWLAYTIVSAERRTRVWNPVTSVGIYLALFGVVSYGLLTIWSWMSPKLTDTFPSENDYLFAGILILAAVVVFALDLLGKIDMMGKMRDSMNRANPGPGTGAGPV
jgi:hypothetical protein